jgi:hypothetical protein
VASLKVDWFIDLPNDYGLVSTPLVTDGVLYFCDKHAISTNVGINKTLPNLCFKKNGRILV